MTTKRNYDLEDRYEGPVYEYLTRWPCTCHFRGPCDQCDGRGYLEEWLSFETLKFQPITITDYRVARKPACLQHYATSKPHDDEIVRDAEMDPA